MHYLIWFYTITFIQSSYLNYTSFYFQIDFGDVGGAIDFSTADIELAENLTTGDIDWGNLSTEEPQTIDWGVDVVCNIPKI